MIGNVEVSEMVAKVICAGLLEVAQFILKLFKTVCEAELDLEHAMNRIEDLRAELRKAKDARAALFALNESERKRYEELKALEYRFSALSLIEKELNVHAQLLCTYIHRSDKIGAIKYVRMVSGCGLLDAKNWVEAHWNDQEILDPYMYQSSKLVFPEATKQ